MFVFVVFLQDRETFIHKYICKFLSLKAFLSFSDNKKKNYSLSFLFFFIEFVIFMFYPYLPVFVDMFCGLIVFAFPLALWNLLWTFF